MKNPSKIITFLGLILIIALIESCVSFKPGWNHFAENTGTFDIEKLLNEAHQIEATASSSDDLLKLIDAFKKIEQSDPYNYYALWKIGNYNILMGAAYLSVC